MLNTFLSKIIVLSIFFIVILFLGLYSINLFESNKKEYYLDVQSELLQTKYDTSYKYFKIMSSDIFEMYSKNKKLINLFAQAKNANTKKQALIRKQIYNLIFKNYKRLNRMGISQVHFHLPNNTSFLRMDSPLEYGDDLKNIRKSVVKTNSTLLTQEGFEVCKFMSGARFVYPIFDLNHQHIGSVEIAFSSKKLLESIEDDFIYDSHILISKDILKKALSKQEINKNFINSWEISDFYMDNSIHKKMGDINLYQVLKQQSMNDASIIENIKNGVARDNPFTISTQYNYQNILLTYLPLSDTNNNKKISYIVTYTESDYLSNVQTEENYIKLMYFIVVVMLALFSVYVIYTQEKLKVLALYDSLTTLPNRTLFTIEFQNEITRAFRYDTVLALLFLDLDGFKAVNDTYGHDVGDKLLQNVSQTFLSQVRQSDIVARLGGDEFVILLVDIEDTDKILQISQKILDTINEPIIIDDKSLHVGTSIGIALFPDHAKDTKTLMKYADSMMYQSKENGKNQITLFNNKEI